MRNTNIIVSCVAVIILLFGANAIFAQCGADGMQPCNPTPKKTTPKKTTNPIVSKPATPTKKTLANVSRTQSKFVPRAPDIELVKIPAGSFTMGSNDDYDRHRVNISYSFYMGKYEITQAQWRAVLGNNPSYSKGCGEDCPVDQISWKDIQKFIQKLNSIQNEYEYRLPSESEWEYSCRAGTTTIWSFGDDEKDFDEYAWSNKPSNDESHKVGQKKPNNWGLYDMHGNVWEWCEDVYTNDYTGLPADGSANISVGDLNLRVQRGGSRVVLKSLASSTARRSDELDGRDIYSGFRVVALSK